VTEIPVGLPTERVTSVTDFDTIVECDDKSGRLDADDATLNNHAGM